VFRVGEITLGYVHQIPIARHVALGAGLQATVDFVPAGLQPAYRASEPTGVMPFVRIAIR
jgi:hypothetical protein